MESIAIDRKMYLFSSYISAVSNLSYDIFPNFEDNFVGKIRVGWLFAFHSAYTEERRLLVG